jgi:hypothetical protein
MAQKSAETSRSARPSRAQRWHAVAIRPQGKSCDAAHACRAARFLSAEAPRLPLRECTVSDTCTCVYKHHPDRRLGPRRQQDGAGLARSGKSGQERRKAGDRRRSDLD